VVRVRILIRQKAAESAVVAPAAAETWHSHVAVDIPDPLIESRDLSVWYGQKQAIHKVNLKFPPHQVTAIIGPSGCGKSTVLRSINRMNDMIPICRTEGQMIVDGEDAYGPNVDPVLLRRKIGLIFQKPNPFPKSVYENIAFGVKLHYKATKEEIDEVVTGALQQANLWEEVQGRMEESALSLSGGQQQRLCIARALAVEPDILLMDEPCSALDPVATAKIEDLIFELKKDMTIVIVTHNMQQAARVADFTAFMYLGRLVEFDRTRDLFERPHEELTENYITGRFG
jgi:phosphate transport system ATP-binding protein